MFTGASSVAVTRRPYHGRVVRVIQPHGCPKNGTMGHVYVEVAETREFIGLVLINSLTNESGGRDQPRRLTRARACYRLAAKAERAGNYQLWDHYRELADRLVRMEELATREIGPGGD